MQGMRPTQVPVPGTRLARPPGPGHGANTDEAENREGLDAASPLAGDANFHARGHTDGQQRSHRIDVIEGDCCDHRFVQFARDWNRFERHHEMLARMTCPSVCFGVPMLALVVTSVSCASRGDSGVGIVAGCFAGLFGLAWLGCVAFRVGHIVKREAMSAQRRPHVGR